MTAQSTACSFSISMLSHFIKLNIKARKYYRDFKKAFVNMTPLFASCQEFCGSAICLHQQQEQNTTGSGSNGAAAALQFLGDSDRF